MCDVSTRKRATSTLGEAQSDGEEPGDVKKSEKECECAFPLSSVTFRDVTFLQWPYSASCRGTPHPHLTLTITVTLSLPYRLTLPLTLTLTVTVTLTLTLAPRPPTELHEAPHPGAPASDYVRRLLRPSTQAPLREFGRQAGLRVCQRRSRRGVRLRPIRRGAKWVRGTHGADSGHYGPGRLP